MPLMIVSDDEWNLELSHLQRRDNNSRDNNSLTVTEIERGRGSGSLETPNSLRELISEEANLGTPAAEIARVFPISESSISAYKVGATSTASYNQPVDKLLAVRSRIANKASNRIIQALNALGTKNLAREEAKDCSSIAKDMAVVFDKLSPAKSAEREAVTGLHLHIYAPKMKSTEDYEIIDV